MAAGAAASAVSPDAQAAELWAALADPLNALRRIGASAQSRADLEEVVEIHLPTSPCCCHGQPLPGGSMCNLTCCMNIA